jgi:hypothetical protein
MRVFRGVRRGLVGELKEGIALTLYIDGCYILWRKIIAEML